jgi:SAM-dependent methyltransferase
VLRPCKKTFKFWYEEIKTAYLNECGYKVPLCYRSAFVHWGGGADTQFIFRQFLGELLPKATILIIGVMGGRDYFLCKNLGYRVLAADLGPQRDIEPILPCNVECGLPFQAGAFDAVILSEVLEHLVRDGQVLAEVRRVLKPDGRLIVSVPYYNDREQGHVRIYSPWSAKRLLNVSGFRIEDYVERPAIVWPGRANLLFHLLSLGSYRLSKHTVYRFVTGIAGRIEYRLGHVSALRHVRRMSKHYGGYYLCSKGEAMDHVALNKELYTGA